MKDEVLLNGFVCLKEDLRFRVISKSLFSALGLFVIRAILYGLIRSEVTLFFSFIVSSHGQTHYSLKKN